MQRQHLRPLNGTKLADLPASQSRNRQKISAARTFAFGLPFLSIVPAKSLLGSTSVIPPTAATGIGGEASGSRVDRVG